MAEFYAQVIQSTKLFFLEESMLVSFDIEAVINSQHLSTVGITIIATSVLCPKDTLFEHKLWCFY